MVDESDTRRSVTRKVSRRLVPLLFASYFVACLDRFNISFAALQMNADLGLSQTAFGLGAGIFFLGYFLFEVPSNLILARVGARLWLARIMVTWGIISVCMMFVQSAPGFYALRFMLGVAEAGFLPGAIFYTTKWLPARERTAVIAKLVSALPLAGILGGPIAGTLLSLDGVGDLRGWQWLFLVEGLPAIVLGLIVLRALPEGPEAVAWLTKEEGVWVRENINNDQADGHDERHIALATLLNPRFWFFGIVLFLLAVGTYGVVFWMPQILKAASGGSDFQIGLLAAIPQVSAAFWMIIGGRSSEYFNERRWHIAVSGLIGGCGVAALGLATGLAPLLLAASIAYVSAVFTGPFWALASAPVRGAVAAGGIAFINSCGAVAGFVGPYTIGLMAERASTTVVFIVLGALLAAGGLLTLAVADKAA